MKILHINGTILYADEALTIKETVENVVKAGVSLSGAYLYCANLRSVDLSGANLSGAYLYCANLRGANLRGANLYGADLSYADLRGANLRGANLYGADLSYADLRGAYLSYADLSGANNFNFDSPEFQRTRILPEGSIIGWKKCHGGTLVKLQIPEEAKRSQAFGRKCRAEYADVLAIFDREGHPCDEARAIHDSGATVYKVGTRVYPDGFSDNWQEECAPGIHFFITRAEAQDY